MIQRVSRHIARNRTSLYVPVSKEGDLTNCSLQHLLFISLPGHFPDQHYTRHFRSSIFNQLFFVLFLNLTSFTIAQHVLLQGRRPRSCNCFQRSIRRSSEERSVCDRQLDCDCKREHGTCPGPLSGIGDSHQKGKCVWRMEDRIRL